MALDISKWIPLEWSPEVVARVGQASAVEGYGRSEAMNTASKRVLRSAGMVVGVGGTYSADTSGADYITLEASKFTGQAVLDEDDLADAEMVINAIGTKNADWATSYAVEFDNACLAVTAHTAVVDTTVPFKSVHASVRTNGDAGTDYVADANYVNYNGQASGAYDAFSDTLSRVENGFYFDPSRALVIAHTAFRDVFRRTKDDVGQPIFVQGLAGTPDTLFGIPVAWSRGARTSATATQNPTGNPLLIFVGNTDLMIRGDRTNPEALVDTARAHDSTDETALKLRVRKGFSVGHPAAFSVLEKIS